MKNLRILIAEDSKAVRKALVRQLESFGAQIIQAEDGLSGLVKAHEHQPDLVVTDIIMPKMSGFDLCKALKAEANTRHIPVVILSANENEESIEQGFEVGAAAYVSKMNASQELLACVRDLLEKSTLLLNKRILVVDESTTIRKIITQGLLGAGFQVDQAGNGAEALELLTRHKPDLVITDAHALMPDGIPLYEAIRHNQALNDIPILVMSSETDRRRMREIIQRGASGCVIKPFHVDHLVISVEKLLCDHFRILLGEKERLTHERDMLLASISSLIQALEARDSYTRGHSECVAAISVAMAKAMGYSTEDIQKINLCAKLHDIGKIGISDLVLLKPGKLSADEFALIKEHPATGADILSPIPSMAEIIPGVLQHHEKMDGTGYPQGLTGDQIHPWARIIAVADVFHALTSHRPYRPAMPLDTAMQIIRESAGTHFCPHCVQVFEHVLSTHPEFMDPEIFLENTSPHATHHEEQGHDF